MEELKPCPFCGRTDTIEADSYKCDGKDWFYVIDQECGAQGPVCSTKEMAIATWNTRAGAEAKSPETQKPSWEIEPYPKHMVEGEKAPFCPICRQDLLDESNDCFNYCPSCGQRIDWD